MVHYLSLEYKIVFWKKKKNEDLEDLLVSFRLDFVNVEVNSCISIMYYLLLWIYVVLIVKKRVHPQLANGCLWHTSCLHPRPQIINTFDTSCLHPHVNHASTCVVLNLQRKLPNSGQLRDDVRCQACVVFHFTNTLMFSPLQWTVDRLDHHFLSIPCTV
jgi:hypothetical protein